MSNNSDSSSNIERWLVPALIILFASGAFALTLSFDRMPPILKRGIQPSDFPQLVCLLIISLTVIMAWRDPVKVTEPFGSKTLGTIFLIGMFAAITYVDLFLALSIFSGLLAFYWGEKRLIYLIGVTLLVPICVFFLFDMVFEIRFPRGILTSLWYG